MDFTGRRQSTNVDDRRKNWLLYEAFRPLGPRHQTIADNRHTRAVEGAIRTAGDQPILRSRRPGGPAVPVGIQTQEEFDRLLEEEQELPRPEEARSIIGNLLRK